MGVPDQNRRKARAAICIANRERLITAAWQRFCRLAVEQKIVPESCAEAFERNGTMERRRQIIIQALKSRSITGFRFANALEAAEFGENLFTPSEIAQATNAVPGTRDKVEIMAARLQAGFELQHPNDRPDYEERDEPQLQSA